MILDVSPMTLLVALENSTETWSPWNRSVLELICYAFAVMMGGGYKRSRRLTFKFTFNFTVLLSSILSMLMICRWTLKSAILTLQLGPHSCEPSSYLSEKNSTHHSDPILHRCALHFTGSSKRMEELTISIRKEVCHIKAPHHH